MIHLHLKAGVEKGHKLNRDLNNKPFPTKQHLLYIIILTKSRQGKAYDKIILV